MTSSNDRTCKLRFPADGVLLDAQGGSPDLKQFCAAHASDIPVVLRDLGEAFVGPQQLSQRDALGAGLEPHHYFVSEVIHEAIGP